MGVFYFMDIHLELMDIFAIQFADNNPKKHDATAMYQSISKYGVIEFPVINETTLKLVAGHGRIETLREMFRHDPKHPPKNVIAKDSTWFVPVTRGHAFRSDQEAQAYLIDSNNIGLMGAEFTPFDMMKLWDEDAYKEMLTELAKEGALPISVEGDDLDALLANLDFSDNPDTKPSAEDLSTAGDIPTYKVVVECQDDEQKEALMERLRSEGFLCR